MQFDKFAVGPGGFDLSQSNNAGGGGVPAENKSEVKSIDYTFASPFK